jgi:mono/diheme cytochrome c family protein
MNTTPGTILTRFGPKCRLVIAATLLAVPLCAAQAIATRTPENTRLIESTTGPALYTAYCSVCHGWGGKGGGPMAKYLKVRPPDLTRIAIRNRGMFSRDRIERVISGAETLPRGHGTKEMPVWGPVFSQIDWDRDFGPVRVANLAGYLSRRCRRSSSADSSLKLIQWRR